MGTTYKLGGMNKSGIDCSAFVANVYKDVFEFKLPRTVRDQKRVGVMVNGALEPGDLIFFRINNRISHVGIYVFDHKFIHAASAGPETGVIKSSLEEPYYKKHFAFAKRVIKLPRYRSIYKNKDTRTATMLIGKKNYNGMVFNLSETFIQNEPVYIQIQGESKYHYQLVIEKDRDFSKKCRVQMVKGKRSFKMVDLTSGEYSLTLLDGHNEIVSVKKIKVL